MIQKILLITLLVLVFSWSQGLYAEFTTIKPENIKINPQNPVVLELFTSQSCSSCPPADKNLTALTQNPNVIALGYHVTYWDHLHWKDTLGREFATQRQRSYARAKSSKRVYTPQLVINGQKDIVGSKSSAVKTAINKRSSVKPIEITHTTSGKLKATLPQLKTGSYTIYIAGLKTAHTQNIPSGENRGRTVEYTNAVLTLDSLGTWNGTQTTREFTTEPSPDVVDQYVILAQQNTHGPIIAAGKIKLK